MRWFRRAQGTLSQNQVCLSQQGAHSSNRWESIQETIRSCKYTTEVRSFGTASHFLLTLCFHSLRSKTPPSTLSTFTARRRRTEMRGRQPLRSSSSFLRWKRTYSSRWLTVSCSGRRLWWNTRRRDLMLMLSLIRWLRRTTRWSESTRWSRSRASRTWFSRLMKRRPFCKGRRNSRSTRRSSCDSMLPNSKKGLTIYRPWKWRLRHSERPSLTSLLRRKRIAEINKSI